MNHTASTSRLCLSCGLCCNGVLFSDVELLPGDDSTGELAAVLRARRRRGSEGALRFAQPCAALCADNRCQLYDQRPTRCREFDCGVLKEVRMGTLEMPAALRLVAKTRRQAEQVCVLLRQLGDEEEHLPLSVRFRRARRRIETGTATTEMADLFGELTLAVHQLNVLTHARFHTRADNPPD